MGFFLFSRSEMTTEWAGAPGEAHMRAFTCLATRSASPPEMFFRANGAPYIGFCSTCPTEMTWEPQRQDRAASPSPSGIFPHANR